MVSPKSVDDQLKKIKFNPGSWNRPETVELAAILLPDEQIFECVNGWYEGGFALLCATDMRILLVDKKPFRFLTVEDLRFDMINQIDYSHRMMDARISVSAGMKNLKFRSYNKERLRKLIGHVQHRMAEIKTEQSSHTQLQQEHLKQIDQQLQTYLLAQYQQHESMRRQFANSDIKFGLSASSEAEQPDRSLEAAVVDGSASQGWANEWAGSNLTVEPAVTPKKLGGPVLQNNGVSTDELYEDGVREIYGKKKIAETYTEDQVTVPDRQVASNGIAQSGYPSTGSASSSPLEINPLRIAYSKLPMVLRNRQYGRTSLKRSVVRPDPVA